MRTLACIVVLLCAGCATYTTPGAAVPLAALGRADIAEGSSRQPAPQFPASIAVVRVQAAPYRSYSAEGYGSGRYSVIVAPDESMQAIASWPSVERVNGIDTTFLPEKLDTLGALRGAAAKTQADVLLIDTVDTTFKLQGRELPPASDIGLGAKAGGPATITVVATAIFVDVRTGYVYGSTSATADVDAAGALRARDDLERKRIEVERSALKELLKNAGQTWAGIVQHYR